MNIRRTMNRHMYDNLGYERLRFTLLKFMLFVIVIPAVAWFTAALFH